MIDWEDVIQLYGQGYGTSTIGEKYGVKANTIRRGLISRGIKMRTISESQKLRLDNGIAEHPTAGKTRPDSVKKKIAEKSHQTWKNKSEKEKLEHKERSKEWWDNRPPELVEQMKESSAKGIRRAAKEGSQLERFLLNKIRETGRDVIWHASNFLENVDLEVDLLLPNDKIAIEADGVFHVQPVFSQEQFEKTLRADATKNGLLMKNGYCVIRVRNTRKNMSIPFYDRLWSEVNKLIEEINSNFPGIDNRLFEISIG